RTYREMLFTAPGGAEFISGVIMQDETIRQKSSDGTPLAEVLSKQDILPGIKVDIGAKPLAGLSRRNSNRGARRAPGSPLRVPWHGRPLREVAGSHPYHGRSAERRLRQRECACARALCRALSRTGSRSDRRAGSADGWIAFDG